jgi:hypothetical protein
MLEHVQCDQCGGYPLRYTAVCPACGNPLPGRGLLRGTLIFLLLASVITVVAVFASWLWLPSVKLVGDMAAHDARIHHSLQGEQEHAAAAGNCAKEQHSAERAGSANVRPAGH